MITLLAQNPTSPVTSTSSDPGLTSDSDLTSDLYILDSDSLVSFTCKAGAGTLSMRGERCFLGSFMAYKVNFSAVDFSLSFYLVQSYDNSLVLDRGTLDSSHVYC